MIPDLDSIRTIYILGAKFHIIVQYSLSGACMRNLNVSMGDSRDEKGLKRFFPFTPRDHLIPSKISVMYIYLYLHFYVCKSKDLVRRTGHMNCIQNGKR